jgi:hypothetical protein
MKNLNEEVNRIKKIMSIDEQCGGDWDKCEDDLERQGYKVSSPNELKVSCENNTIIKCVNDILSSNNISDIIISSAGDSTKDCYVLVKSTKKQNGLPKFMITFYSDNQVVIEIILNSENDNDKIVYRGKYECGGTNLKILGNKFKYIGVKKSGSVTINNSFVKANDGTFVIVDSSESGNMKIPSGKLKYSHFLTYYSNLLSTVNNINILTNGLNKNQIIDILTH